MKELLSKATTNQKQANKRKEKRTENMYLDLCDSQKIKQYNSKAVQFHLSEVLEWSCMWW